MKFDNKCTHGVDAWSNGDCTEPRKEGSVLCEYHHQLVVDGKEKAPPLRIMPDYNPMAKISLSVNSDYSVKESSLSLEEQKEKIIKL